MPHPSRRAVLGTLAALPFAARAQGFGDKPVELVVPFVAGTAPDAVARGLADGMGRQLGQTVIVSNRPGAGGAIGYRYAREQKPDGNTLVLNSNSVSTCFHGGLMNFDYTAFDSLARVTLEFPVFVVRSDSPFRNLKDAVDFARQKPGDLRVGATSIGSHMHLTSVAFFADEKVEVTQVPFATSAHVASLLGGHLDALVTLPASVAGQVQSGQLKVLGVLASMREPVFNGVPTAREQGIPFASDLWRGIAAPKGLQPAVSAKLQEAIRKTVTSPEFRQLGDRIGFQPAFQPADAFARTIATEDTQIAALMKKHGIQMK